MGRAKDKDLETKFVKVMHGASANRKFRQMGRQLGISHFDAFGITVALWELVDITNPYGDLPSDWTPIDIADSLRVEHIDPDDLVKAWIDAKLIDRSDDGLSIHGWMEGHRTGAAAEFRTMRARKGAHVKNHEKTGLLNADNCQFCAEALLNGAQAPPERAPTSTSSSPSRSSSLKGGLPRSGEYENAPPEYEDDDPERPFR